MAQFVLASQSPRRRQLLEWAEIDFEVLVHTTDESFPGHLTPAEAAQHIAREKGKAVLPHASGRTVIAADTIVVLNHEIIGKPANRNEAIDILTRLSGATHTVITGVYISDGKREFTFFDETEVAFHALSRDEILFYIDKYQPYDKAGAYAIQEWIGVVGIRRINGDFYNVMGLPVSRVVNILKNFVN